jgi:hypothetical protein
MTAKARWKPDGAGRRDQKPKFRIRVHVEYVMTGLVAVIHADKPHENSQSARIHASSATLKQRPGVDTRDKRGYDGHCSPWCRACPRQGNRFRLMRWPSAERI